MHRSPAEPKPALTIASAARAICDKLQTLANMMAAADEQRCRELISAIDYEMVWWRVYDQMTPGGTATSGVHGRGQGA